MNEAKPFYVKSLEEDLATQRLVNGVKQPFQSVENMVRSSIILPNTVSFGQADRLACTVLTEEYMQTYRPQGIIFQTDENPDYMAPFDLMVLANVPGEKILSDYYSIVDELKEHYGRALMPGYHDFLFKTIEEMLAVIPDPEAAWSMVNDLRERYGLSPIPESEKNLVAYNEAIFHREVPVTPIALFGKEELVPRLSERAELLGLKVYGSAREFYEEKMREIAGERMREFKMSMR